MTSGIKFFNKGLAALLDNNKIVPQLVLRVDMATQDQFDMPTTQPGWNLRLFRWLIPEWLIGRPYIGFCSIPDQGHEVFGNGAFIAYQNGQPFVAPVVYIFALDYVTYSGNGHGMRLWKDNAGPLVYDSGNFHLNLQKSGVVSVDMAVGSKGTNYPTGGTRGFNLGFPINCAISIPYVEIFRDWGTRFDAYGQFRANALLRNYGGQIQTKMFSIEEEINEADGSNENYDHIYKGNGDAIQLLAIDRSMYD